MNDILALAIKVCSVASELILTQHVFMLLYIVDGEIVPTDSKTSAFSVYGYRRVYVQMQTFLSFQSATKFAGIDNAVVSVSRVTLLLNTFAQDIIIIIVVVGVISRIRFVEERRSQSNPPNTHTRRVPLTH